MGLSIRQRIVQKQVGRYLTSISVLLIVLTNDLHQLVFTFPEDAAVWSDRDHGYGIGYFPVIGWQVCCGVAALVAECVLQSRSFVACK